MLAQIDTEYDAGALAGAERVTLIATVTLKTDGPGR
jgi:hypothetical protein